MASEDPAKALLPFLQRADELQKHEPLISYYCRLYAMDQGLKIPASERSKETSDLLRSLMSQLEKDKSVVQRSPEDNLYVEGFAQRVFSKADKQDRAGQADISTAKTFYAAGIFFEVASQFGPLAAELEQKQKYAVWKAGDIRKALKEGRTPTPGPPGGDENIRKQFGSAASTSLNAGPGGPAGVPPQAPAFPQGAPSAPAPAFDAFGLPAAPSLAPSLSGRTPPAAGAPPAAPAGRWAQPPSQGAPEGSYGAPSSTGYQGNGPQGFGGLPNGQPTQPAPQFPHLDPANAPSSQPPSSLPYAHPVAPPAYPQASAPSAPPFGGSVPSHQGATTGGAFGLPSGTQALQFATAVPGGGSFYDGQAPSAPAPPPSTSSSAPSGADVSHVTAQASSMSLGSTAAPAPAPTPAFSSSGVQPTPGKVAEAHKSARFAVSALAFDDVPTAIEYLRKSLDLLTKP